MKKVAILQSNYIPWKGYFDIINSVDEFILYDDVQYTKNDWRNRNRIKTPNGPQWITIPVFHSTGQTILQTKVSRSNWNIKHWKVLKQNYSKAPYFTEVRDFVESLYLTCETSYLSEINAHFIRSICAFFGIETQISLSSDYQYGGGKSERILSLCKAASAQQYLTGASAKSYLDEPLLNSGGVMVEWMSYEGYPEYNQPHPPFKHGVSILDLMFSVGNNANFLNK